MGSELHRAVTDAVNRLTVHAYEHEDEEPMSEEMILARIKALTAQVEGATGKMSSRRKRRVALMELAVFAIAAAADTDKK